MCSVQRGKRAHTVQQPKSAPVGVLTKVLAIFELLDRSYGGLQLRHIAERTALNKSTAYRFLAHLERAGYLLRDHSGAYLIGPRLVHLGANSTYQATIRQVSRPGMHLLWSRVGETVNLGALDRGEVLYLDVLESSHTFRLSSQVGMRRPVHTTALGKAILAWLPSQTRDELLASCINQRRGNSGALDIGETLSDLGRIQRRGYALDNEEVEPGACCVGAPIFDSSGSVAASISISGPVTRMHGSRISAIAKDVMAAAAEISELLGYKRSLPAQENPAQHKRAKR